MPTGKKELGGNLWLVWLNSYDDNGRRQRKQLQVKGKRAAERERQRLEREFGAGTLILRDRSVLSELLDAWLAAAKESLKPKTVERYREIVELHIKPKLGGTRLDRLQKHPEIICTFLIERRGHGGRGGRELARRTVVHIYRCLHTALQWACEDNKLSLNPADASSVRKLARAYSRQADAGFQPTVMDAQEMKRLLDASRGTILFLPILLAVSAGLRRGETLGLRWRDVDLGEGVLEVRHTLQQTRDAGVFEGTPKSLKSLRDLALPAFVVRELRAERARLGNEADLDRYVCCEADGAAIAPGYLTSRFAAFIRQNGFPKVRFHDLRHSNGTLMHTEGVGAKTIGDRLGHASSAFTMRTYIHSTDKANREAAAAVDAAFGRVGQNPVNNPPAGDEIPQLRLVK